MLTYETVQEETGEMRVFAVMNKDFVSSLTLPVMEDVFADVSERYGLVSEDGLNFAVVVSADEGSNERAITEAIDRVNETGPEVEIVTNQIENRLGYGTDITPTALSLQDALMRVKGWVDQGVFAPQDEAAFEFPE